MAKITDFEFMGNKGNVLNVKDWTGLILGAFVSLMAFSVGQWLFQKTAPKSPAGGIEPIVSGGQTPQKTNNGVYGLK